MSEETKKQKPSLLGMITSPVEQFERIKERPIIWLAMTIIIIFTIVGGWLASLGTEIPELEGMDTDMQASIGIFAIVVIIIASVFGALVGTLISSAIYLIIAKIAQSPVSFKQLFSMNTYIMTISALSWVFNGIIIALIGGNSEKLPTSLGSIVHTEGAMEGLFSSIEVFTIWGFILTALGLQKVAGFSKGLAWTIAVAFFIISVIFAMISTAVNGMTGV